MNSLIIDLSVVNLNKAFRCLNIKVLFNSAGLIISTIDSFDAVMPDTTIF